MRRVLSTVVVLFAATILRGKPLYVAPSGDDTFGNGTLEAPFASLGAAAAIAAPGDTVYLRGGVYRLDKGLRIGGLTDVAFVAYPGEEPILSGSVPLGKWRRVTDRKILAKVGAAAAKRLYVTGLAKAGIEDLGNPIKDGHRPELFCRGEIQTLARWPQSGFTYGGRALGETIIPPVPNGNSGAVEPVFEYTDDRIARWADEKDPCAGGYWFYDWTDKYVRIKEVDTRRKSLTVDSGKRFRHGLRYFGLNLMCEIDTPGEWYIDRETALLYWFAPEGVNPVKNAEGITLSLCEDRYLLSAADCGNVSFEGISFVESRGGGLRIDRGADCAVLDCRFEGLGSHAVWVAGGVGHMVDGCYIAHVSRQGIHMEGGDRRTLEHSGFVISNNYLEDFSRFQRTYAVGISFDGCGVHVHHNELRDSPSSALSLGGNDIVAEYNLIDGVAGESDDQGGYDLFLNPSMRGIVLRYNRWRNIVGGTRYGVAAIRLDDLICGVRIYGNLFENCGAVEFGAVQIHGGSENTVEDNVFYGCRYAVSITPDGEELLEVNKDKIPRMMHGEVETESPLYRLCYPELAEFPKHVNVNIIRNNLVLDTGEALFFNDKGIQITSGNVERSSGGRPAEEFCTAEYLNPLGIKMVPVEEMHILRNIWINK